MKKVGVFSPKTDKEAHQPTISRLGLLNRQWLFCRLLVRRWLCGGAVAAEHRRMWQGYYHQQYSSCNDGFHTFREDLL